MTERIDFTKSEQYTLSIRLSADGFSFSIYNPLTDNDFCFVPYPVRHRILYDGQSEGYADRTEL